MFFVVTLLVFAIDILIKTAVAIKIAHEQSIPIIKGVLSLTYLRNPGVAFGLFPGQRIFLIAIGIIICSLVLYFYSRVAKSDIWLILSFALILGGSIGNLVDRIFFGYVVDYIDFGFFPVFNFADIAINVGVFIIILSVIFRRTECIQ